MEKHPEIGLVGGSAGVDWCKRRSAWWVYDFPLEYKEIQAMIPTQNPFCHSAVLMRSDAFRQVLGYRTIFTQSHDYDLWLRISEQFQCANLPQVLIKYRVHPRQISWSKRRQQALCGLAAEASALSRKTGQPDVLTMSQEINPALLVSMGVTEPIQQRSSGRSARIVDRSHLKSRRIPAGPQGQRGNIEVKYETSDAIANSRLPRSSCEV